jgi:hypothetical protein
MYDEPPKIDDPPEIKGVLLEELGFAQCRYVVSKTVSPAVYCGKPAQRGGSWCSEHRARVMVTPPAPRPRSSK